MICLMFYGGICSSSAAESAEEEAPVRPGTEQTGGSEARPWQDDREDTTPFDRTEVVWAPTPAIRQKMLSMRTKVRFAFLTDVSMIPDLLTGCTHMRLYRRPCPRNGWRHHDTHLISHDVTPPARAHKGS